MVVDVDQVVLIDFGHAGVLMHEPGRFRMRSEEYVQSCQSGFTLENSSAVLC